MDGIRTVAGLGSWTGWVSSLEYDLCLDLGYKFEILKGYKFDKKIIFKEYVETLYSLRLKYDKTHPLNLVAKLLMNSLYGKFGMQAYSTSVQIYDSTSVKQMEYLHDLLEITGESIQDLLKIDRFLILQSKSINYKYDKSEDLYHGLDVNIAIASTVTAGARCIMSKPKNNSIANIYYTDTDSIITDVPLPESEVGSELGKFKLECIIDRAVFLAPPQKN